MKAFGYLAALLLIDSCARVSEPTGPYRGVSSISTQVSSLGLEDIQGEMRDKYQQIEYLTLSAYELLGQFDSHLESNPGPLLENPHYPGLLAARTQIEELEENIIELRDQFYLTALDNQNNTEDRIKSIELLRATRPEIEGLQDQIIKLRLSQNFTQFTKQMLLDLARIDDVAVKSSMEKLYNDFNASYGPMVEKSNPSAQWKQITSKARQTLKNNAEWLSMRRNFEHLTQEMRTELLYLSKEKQATLRFYPSAQKPGNIIGTEFPDKVWSLTFDDGPGVGTSKKVVDNLVRHELRATFFQLTKNVKELPSEAKYIREMGMDLASHSYNHRQTPKLSLEQRDYEISVAASELGDLHARKMKLYRLPYGAGVSITDIRNRIAKANLVHVFWSVDTLDWMPQDPSEVVARTKKQILASKKDSGVILFHDVHERTVIASEEIMRFLKQDSRRVCTVEEVMEAMNTGAVPCP